MYVCICISISISICICCVFFNRIIWGSAWDLQGLRKYNDASRQAHGFFLLSPSCWFGWLLPRWFGFINQKVFHPNSPFRQGTWFDQVPRAPRKLGPWRKTWWLQAETSGWNMCIHTYICIYIYTWYPPSRNLPFLHIHHMVGSKGGYFTHTYIYICMCVCIYVCTYVRMYVCTYVSIYICVCTYIYMYIYVYVCVYIIIMAVYLYLYLYNYILMNT